MVEEIYTLYDLENDPQEMHEWSAEAPSVFTTMKEELFTRLGDANHPFEQSK